MYNFMHSKLSGGSIIDDERFGRSDKHSNFNYLSCNTNHVSISECTVNNKASSCYISLSTCDIEYSLRCHSKYPQNDLVHALILWLFSDPGECIDGSVRLFNGSIEQDGRVEVCISGVWGIICDYGWGTIDSFLLCSELGYDGPSMRKRFVVINKLYRFAS